MLPGDTGPKAYSACGRAVACGYQIGAADSSEHVLRSPISTCAAQRSDTARDDTSFVLHRCPTVLLSQYLPVILRDTQGIASPACICFGLSMAARTCAALSMPQCGIA
jgi:hypothetical protein